MNTNRQQPYSRGGNRPDRHRNYNGQNGRSPAAPSPAAQHALPPRPEAPAGGYASADGAASGPWQGASSGSWNNGNRSNRRGQGHQASCPQGSSYGGGFQNGQQRFNGTSGAYNNQMYPPYGYPNAGYSNRGPAGQDMNFGASAAPFANTPYGLGAWGTQAYNQFAMPYFPNLPTMPGVPFPPLFPPLHTDNANSVPLGLRGGSDNMSPQFDNNVAPKRKKERHSQPKVPMPRPSIDPLYSQIALEPSVSLDNAQPLLVILDLNGTVLYRPDPRKKPKKIIPRTHLREFLKYLFDNFSVMVWSSARPQNVQSMVDQVLPKDQRAKLVACWARDTFGLGEADYNRNVQVYKDLRLIWADENVQRNCAGYEDGKRFDQTNTILVDDSLEKAWAQQHNLIDIPEFEGQEEATRVLNKLAGYLQAARYQSNISSFMRTTPFDANGDWWYEWPRMEGEVVPAAEDPEAHESEVGSGI